MKTVTIRAAQHGFRALIERVRKGEHLTITRRGRPVARLVPPVPPRKKVGWPDFEARMKRLFPAGTPPGEPASELIRRMREERF
jgi:prevent-host-death family protein